MDPRIADHRKAVLDADHRIIISASDLLAHECRRHWEHLTGLGIGPTTARDLERFVSERARESALQAISDYLSGDHASS